MVATIRVDLSGIDELIDTLGALEARKYLRAVMRQAGEEVKGDMATYPPRNTNYPLTWPSARSRAAYFAIRRSRGLPSRYTRQSDPMSQRLGPSWTTRVAIDGMSATVGNKATYARLVQTREGQTQMHKTTGWPTAEDVADRRADDIVDMVVRAIDKAIG